MKLLNGGRADPGYDDNDALIGACLNGMLGLATALVEAGADPSARNNACIKLACASGNQDLVDFLLSDDRVNARDSGNFAVKHAWSNNIVRLLITSDKINPKEKDRDGKTLLHHACIHGNWNVAALLVNDNGLDPFERDISGQSPIDFVFSGGFSEFDIFTFLHENVYWSRMRWMWMKMYEDFVLAEYGWIPSDVVMGDGESETHIPKLNLNADICRNIASFLHQLLWSEAEKGISIYNAKTKSKKNKRQNNDEEMASYDSSYDSDEEDTDMLSSEEEF